MAMHSDVSYTAYTTSSRGKNGNITTFTRFKEGNLLSDTHNLLSETCDYTECGKEYDDNSTMQPLTSEEEMDMMSSGDEFDDEPISM